MREALLKLIDMCKETDGLRIEIDPFFDEVLVTIFGSKRRCRQVITRRLIEECEDAEALIKAAIEICNDDIEK